MSDDKKFDMRYNLLIKDDQYGYEPKINKPVLPCLKWWDAYMKSPSYEKMIKMVDKNNDQDSFDN